MGHCRRLSAFRGAIKVSEKGQITIPRYLQEELNINKGDHLLLVLRDDKKGFNVLKESIIENVINDKKYT